MLRALGAPKHLGRCLKPAAVACVPSRRRRHPQVMASSGNSSSQPPGPAHTRGGAARAYAGVLYGRDAGQKQQQQQQPGQQADSRPQATNTTPAKPRTVEQLQLPHTHHQFHYALLPPNWEPLVGRSRQHQRVQKEVRAAAASSSPLVICGDAGLNKLRVAASVHALGLSAEDVNHPLVVVDCSTTAGMAEAAQLLVAGHAAAGATSSMDVTLDCVLMSALPGGTLVLNNMHMAPARLLALADEAVANLAAAAPPASSPAAAAVPVGVPEEWQQEGEAPGQLLQQFGTRLILISQLPLAKLSERLQLRQPPQPGASGPAPAPAPAPATAAASGGDGGRAGLAGCRAIAVPPLRARASDIVPLAAQAGQGPAGLRGYAGIELSEAAQLQLTSYEWPGNEAELQGLIKRAVMLHPPAAAAAAAAAPGSVVDASPHGSDAGADGSSSSSRGGGSASGTPPPPPPLLLLDAADVWGATGAADRERIDVLEVFPWLRRYVLNTGVWPVGLNRITRYLYPLVVASLFLGPQDRESSAALTVFWAGWWPLVMLSFPFVGRAWCAICPFMLTGEVAQGLVSNTDAATVSSSASALQGAAPAAASTPAAGGGSSSGGGGGPGLAAAARAVQSLGHEVHKAATPLRWKLQHWPAEQIEAWSGAFVVGAFAAILMWEQVWDLPGHAYLSGWLLLLITAGAVACSVVFEKRLWCRYLCPIGAMNGMFAKLSLTEMRSRPGLCAAAACTKPCHNGRLEQHIMDVPAGRAPAPDGGSTCPAAAAMMGGGCGCPPDLGCLPEQGGGCLPAFPATPRGGSGWLGRLFGRLGAESSGSGGCGEAGCPAAAAATAGSTAQQVVREELLPGCPMNASPGSMVDNQMCVMCGNCLRACTGHSAQWRLRPPAADLWNDHHASWTEVSLMYVLLGSVLLHRLPDLCLQLGLPPEHVLSDQGTHLLASGLLLAAPLGVAWLWRQAGAAATKHLQRKATTAAGQGPAAALLGAAGKTSGAAREAVQDVAADTAAADADGLSFLRLSYSVLPLVWAGILAHYEDLLLTELGLTAPRLALSLGAAPDAAWLAALPTLGPAPAAVVSAAQGVTLFLGAALSFALAGQIGAVAVQQRHATQEVADRAVLPQRLLILATAAELWHLIV